MTHEHIEADPLDWEETDAAKQLLSELDAVERSADCCIGREWYEAADAHSRRAQEIEHALSDLRLTATDAYADGHGERESDAWYDAVEEADMLATTVERATAIARNQRWGDVLLAQAA